MLEAQAKPLIWRDEDSNFVLEVANIIGLWLIWDDKCWPCLVKKIEKKSYSLFYKYIGQVNNFIIYYFISNTTKEIIIIRDILSK